jgi:cyclohexanecarboxylate-CoA ligase
MMSGSAIEVPPLSTQARDVLASFGLVMDAPRRDACYRAGWWRRATVLGDFEEVCKARASKTAIVTYRRGHPEPERISYADLYARVQRVAASLLGMGVRCGDVVSVQLPNWWQFAALAMATHWVGAAFNPILPIHRRREVGFITALLESKVCVIARTYKGFDYSEMLAQVRESSPYPATSVVVGGTPDAGELSFEDFILGEAWEERFGRELTECARDPDLVSDVQFTSGTTGEPKGVGHTHNTLYARARALYDPLSLGSEDVVFMPSPLAHSTGFVYGCMTPLMLGMTAVYQDVWDAASALEIIETERASWTFGSTSFIVDLLSARRRRGGDASSLRYFVAGGAPIPPAIVREAREQLGTRVMAVWGMTENGAVTVTQPSEPESAAAESDGVPCPWMELKVARPGSGGELPPGAEGPLYVRGASQMLGYVKRSALTAGAVDEDGWFDTGDLARMGSDGHVRITGRSKDIIIRGGENIPVAEIEALLYEHPLVVDVAVVSYPDERLGERACAVVVPAEGATPSLEDLVSYLAAAGVSRTYWPERLEIRPELPRTASGKVQKFALRHEVSVDGRET